MTVAKTREVRILDLEGDIEASRNLRETIQTSIDKGKVDLEEYKDKDPQQEFLEASLNYSIKFHASILWSEKIWLDELNELKELK